MVCSRCKMVVESELKRFGLHPRSIELGEVEVEDTLNSFQKEELNNRLMQLGFALIDDKKSRLIEKIKNEIITLVRSDEKFKINFSLYISKLLNHDYSYLINLFTSVEGTTIEKYLIAQKIEYVKELLTYDELSLNEIAFKLNYSSAAHLSRQFKQVTGLTPSHFRWLKEKKRVPLEQV